MKKMIRLLAVLTLIVALPFVCGAENTQEAAQPARVAALKGPTGMAISHMMAENDGAYAFTLAGAPEEVNALIISGQVDIAAVPINAGSVIYNKTEGGVRALSLITRGMLYVLEKGDSVQSVKDLEGKTITTAGQGATPEYVTRYILDTNQVNAELDFKSEHAEVTTLAAQGLVDLVLLPEPQVTNLLMKNPDFRVALDVTA
ncbi:MAG: ABC transporter substrate-binding protein [Clostridia bacterium]|nr:ABC transporter substrate-binding protein [Clostridia bacterium]